MAESSLITIIDVQKYRRIDSKFNQERFDAFVNDVQRRNLRGLLGNALYYAFMADARAAGIYKELLDGKVYNGVQYYGLKPALIYWWLAIAARESDLFQANIGAVQFTNNPQQNFETAKEKERLATGYMETANEYANDIIQYLYANSSSYPLWQSATATNQTNFLTFKI